MVLTLSNMGLKQFEQIEQQQQRTKAKKGLSVSSFPVIDMKKACGHMS